MSPGIIQRLIGIVLVYGWGWFSHRNSNVEVPNYIAFIFGRRINKLNRAGIALQVIAIIYLFATLIGIFQKREDLINFYAFGAILLAGIIYLIISVVSAIKKRLQH